MELEMVIERLDDSEPEQCFRAFKLYSEMGKPSITKVSELTGYNIRSIQRWHGQYGWDERLNKIHQYEALMLHESAKTEHKRQIEQHRVREMETSIKLFDAAHTLLTKMLSKIHSYDATSFKDCSPMDAAKMLRYIGICVNYSLAANCKNLSITELMSMLDSGENNRLID